MTLAFAGVYIVSTTLTAKPLLVWETEKGYPRYYVPVESLHDKIKAKLSDSKSTNGHANGGSDKTGSVVLEALETIKGKGNDSEAVIENLHLGERTTTWVRFLGGPLKDFIRFERSEIGMLISNVSAPSPLSFQISHLLDYLLITSL